MKSIDGIKIIQVDGLNRSGSATSGSSSEPSTVGGSNLAEQAMTAALSYRTHAPIVDSLLKEVGLSGGSLAALTAALPNGLGDAALTANDLPVQEHVPVVDSENHPRPA